MKTFITRLYNKIVKSLKANRKPKVGDKVLILDLPKGDITHHFKLNTQGEIIGITPITSSAYTDGYDYKILGISKHSKNTIPQSLSRHEFELID